MDVCIDDEVSHLSQGRVWGRRHLAAGGAFRVERSTFRSCWDAPPTCYIVRVGPTTLEIHVTWHNGFGRLKLESVEKLRGKVPDLTLWKPFVPNLIQEPWKLWFNSAELKEMLFFNVFHLLKLLPKEHPVQVLSGSFRLHLDQKDEGPSQEFGLADVVSQCILVSEAAPGLSKLFWFLEKVHLNPVGSKIRHSFKAIFAIVYFTVHHFLGWGVDFWPVAARNSLLRWWSWTPKWTLCWAPAAAPYRKATRPKRRQFGQLVLAIMLGNRNIFLKTGFETHRNMKCMKTWLKWKSCELDVADMSGELQHF